MSLSVLFVHNRYSQRGGEDSVFEAESGLLEARGHRVSRLIFDNAELAGKKGRSLIDTARLGIETVWSRSAQRQIKAVLESFKPDIVHFHNILPQVSPAAYRTAKQHGSVVVQTLHNFRLACPSGLMYRDGMPCESCLLQPVALSGIVNGCYRDSKAQTTAVAAMLAVHRAAGTWRNDVDLYLSPSQFLKDKVVASGAVPAARVRVKPNFVYPDPGPGSHKGAYVLFAGRLTRTKGIETLLEAYAGRSDGLPPLWVAGEGDLAPAVARAAEHDSRITYVGPKPRDEVLRLMGEARALVFPSIWYENFPMSITEAYAKGLPVIASRIGALPELVEDGVTGLLFQPGDSADLASKLLHVAAGGPRMAAMNDSARHAYASRYSVDRAYEQLLSAYLSAGRKPETTLKHRAEANVI